MTKNIDTLYKTYNSFMVELERISINRVVRYNKKIKKVRHKAARINSVLSGFYESYSHMNNDKYTRSIIFIYKQCYLLLLKFPDVGLDSVAKFKNPALQRNLNSSPIRRAIIQKALEDDELDKYKVKAVFSGVDEVNEILIKIHSDIKRLDLATSEPTKLYTSLNTVLDILKELLLDSFKSNVSNIEKSFLKYNQRFEKLELDFPALTTRLRRFESSYESLQLLIDKSQKSIDSQVSQIVEQTDNSLRALKTESVNQTNDVRVSLRSFQLSLEQKLESKSSSIQTNLESNVEEMINRRITDIEDAKNQATADSIAFRSLYEEMREMYQIAGKGELQRYNLEQAKEEKIEADRLRNYGGIAMLLPLFIAGFIFYDLVFAKPEFTMGWVMTRFLTLSIFSMPMLYALKESANHRYRENLYRQRGTQLATLGSYLDDFDLERKIVLKSELAKNFYSVNTGKADTSHIPDPTAQIKEVAALSKSLSKIIPTQPIMYSKHNHQEVPSSGHLQPDNPTPEKGEDGKPRALNGHG